MHGRELTADIERSVHWDFVRYANVWEDSKVLCAALAPVARDARLFSIASAGDNVLALLTLDPREVVAVDLNLAQLACLELRMAAFRTLDDAELLAFLGVTASASRWSVYREARSLLTPGARAFWDARRSAIETGMIHHGKFERYLRRFARLVLPLVHGRKLRSRIRQHLGETERREIYDREWNTWRWRSLFRLSFGRLGLGRLARDPALLRHAEGSFVDGLLERTRRALSAPSAATNPYLAYILTGSYPADARPLYLRPEAMTVIRQRLERVRLHHGSIADLPGDELFAGGNLSDVFEYMSPTEHADCYRRIVERLAPGARLVYWNLFAHRACPERELDRVRSLDGLSSSLTARDQTWFYQALRVDEVIG